MAQYSMCRFHSHSTVIQDTLKIGQKYSIVPRARERMSERASKRTKRAVWSEQVSGRCERMSVRMSEWLITTDFKRLGITAQSTVHSTVRPKRVSGAAMATHSETHAHTRTHTYTHSHTHTHAHIHTRAQTRRQYKRDSRAGRICGRVSGLVLNRF